MLYTEIYMKVELINIAKTPLVHKKNMVFQRRHGIKAVKEGNSWTRWKGGGIKMRWSSEKVWRGESSKVERAVVAVKSSKLISANKIKGHPSKTSMLDSPSRAGCSNCLPFRQYLKRARQTSKCGMCRKRRRRQRRWLLQTGWARAEGNVSGEVEKLDSDGMEEL